MTYLFDTNIFVTSKNLLPADVWPSFWQRMAGLMKEGKIFSCTKVKEEIEKGNDELTTWMKVNSPKGFYIAIDVEILNQYQSTLNWVNSNKDFKRTALDDYANVADAYLVATAAAKKMVLVTYETPDSTCKKKGEDTRCLHGIRR